MAGSFGSALGFEDQELDRGEFEELEKAVLTLEGGQWTGSILAGERDSKREKVSEIRAILDRLRSAAAVRGESRAGLASAGGSSESRREAIQRNQVELSLALEVEDDRERLSSALQVSVELVGGEGFEKGFVHGELPAAVEIPSPESIKEWLTEELDGLDLEKVTSEFQKVEEKVKERDLLILAQLAKESAALSGEGRKSRAADASKAQAQLAAQVAEKESEKLREQLEVLKQSLQAEKGLVSDLEVELASRPAGGSGGGPVLEPEVVGFHGEAGRGGHGWLQPSRILQEELRAQVGRVVYPNRCTLYRAQPGTGRERDELFELFSFLTVEFLPEGQYEALEYLVPVLTALKDVLQHIRVGDGLQPLLGLQGAGFTLLDEAALLLEDYVLFQLNLARARELAGLRAVALREGALSADAIGERSPMEVRQDFLTKKRREQQYRELPISAEEQRIEEDRAAKTRDMWKSQLLKEQVKADLAVITAAGRRGAPRYHGAGAGAGRGRGGRGGFPRGGAQSAQGAGGS